MILRDYQQDGVDRIRAAIAAHTRRICYVLPTGGGKTVMFAYIARHAAQKGTRVCIIVHRRELLRQVRDELQHPHGVIAAGHAPRRSEPIQVASVDTLVNRLDWYPEFDLLIIDECHHAPAGKWAKVTAAYPRAYILGVTATPTRLDGKPLDMFDTLIEGPSIRWLTDEGYLAPVELYRPGGGFDTTGLHVSRGEFKQPELRRAVSASQIVGNAVDHYRRHADRLPAIAFCVSVEEAEKTAEAFRAAGYRSWCVEGNTPPARREWLTSGLGRGHVDVLTSCDLISEGYNVPTVVCGLLLRPTESLGLARQQIGRILRAAPGKDAAIILDHAGNTLRHGHPYEEIEWTLEGSRAYKRDSDGGAQLRQCLRCFFVHPPAPKCPQCGYVYPTQARQVEVVDGELERVEAERRERVARRREQGAAQSIEALVQIGRRRGYQKPEAWARYVFEARQKRRATA